MSRITSATGSRKRFISDKTWFRKNPCRNFRVRPAVETDHRNFYVHGHSPAGCLTIVKSNQRERLAVVPMCERFGQVCNTDHYALTRVAVMRDRLRRDRMLANLHPLQFA